MTTILKLKVRQRSNTVNVSVEMIKAWLDQSEEDAAQSMYEFFKPIKENEPTVHDKIFLANIINWVPTIRDKAGNITSTGLSLTQQVRWYKLADRLDDVSDEEEGEIKLANKDIDAIMERIKSPEYKMPGLSKPYREFLTDFLRTTHKYFDDFDPSKDDEEIKQPELAIEGSNEHARDKVPAEN